MLYAAVTFTIIPNNDNNTLRTHFQMTIFLVKPNNLWVLLLWCYKSAFYTNDNFQTANGYVRIADTLEEIIPMRVLRINLLCEHEKAE